MNEEHQYAIDRATRLIRGHTQGTLLVDARPYDVLYMVDPHTGSIVLTIEDTMLENEDVVLVIPEDRFDAPMRMSLDLTTTIEEEACDRFMAYHLCQPSPIWVHGQINFAKLESGDVVSQEEIQCPNALINELSGLCKKLNCDRKALAMVCKLLAKTDIVEPTAVGIDPIGFDVRGQFGVVRVEFPSPVENARQAEDVLAALFGSVL
ncbi:MAG: hypothetical protein JKX70_07835 [Phycisphaerales bacterium]|nr:hypothetical protein [Phycisphaerales bacterium]